MIVENLTQIKSEITINLGVSAKMKKKTCRVYILNIMYRNPATCNCENSKYVESIIDNSVIKCDEIIETTKRTVLTKTVPTNFNEKMVTC